MAEAVAFMLEQQELADYPQDKSWHAQKHPRRRSSRSGSVNVVFTTADKDDSFSGEEDPRWGALQLYSRDEAPAILQFNPHVKSGYRAGLTPAQCVCSIFQCHNETGNILSHLIPLLGIVFALLVGWLPAWPGSPLEFVCNLLPIMLCLAGSVVYHTMMANHERYHFWISLDVCGIYLLFLGSPHALLWWGFQCYPLVRVGFVAAYYSTASLAVLMSLKAKSMLWRALPMVALFLVRVAVTSTRFGLNAGSPSATWHYASMEVISLVGGILNTMRAPECWLPVRDGKPGRLDYWLNSHQLMHILVVGSMAHLHYGATLDYRHFASGAPCPA